jgi:hypothetical protein
LELWSVDFNKALLVESSPEEISGGSLNAEDGLRSRSPQIHDSIGQPDAVWNLALTTVDLFMFIENGQLGLLDGERYCDGQRLWVNRNR